MQEEIERILKMREDGKLTREQAAEVIAALSTKDNAGRRDRDGDRGDRRHRHRRHDSRRHSRHRRRQQPFGGLERAFEDIVKNAVNLGSSSVRDAVKFSLKLGPEDWVNDSNTAMFAKADEPEGEDYRCDDNRINVSQIKGLHLVRAEFCNNDLNAAGIARLEITGGKFSDNAMRGSYLKRSLIEDSEVIGNQFNGVQLVGLTLGTAKLTNSRFNGAQVKDFGLANSTMDNTRFNGVNLRSVVLKADSAMNDVTVNGLMGKDWLLDNATMVNVDFKGLRITGLVLDHTRLENCTIRSTDWTGQLERGDLSLVRDLTIEHSMCKNCEFIDCRFDRTTLRNVQASDLVFESVDFTDMTFESTADFARLATGEEVA